MMQNLEQSLDQIDAFPTGAGHFTRKHKKKHKRKTRHKKHIKKYKINLVNQKKCLVVVLT